MTSELDYQRIQALQAENDTLRQQLAESEAAREAANKAHQDLVETDHILENVLLDVCQQHGIKNTFTWGESIASLHLAFKRTEAERDELLQAVVDYFAAVDAIADSEGYFGADMLEQEHQAEKRLRTAVAKLKEAQS